MAEYIEREALIERLKFKRDTDIDKKKYAGLESAIAQVLKFPTADVVPVVRCKDCKHGDFYCNSILCGNAHAPWYNDEFDALMELDDYCSYGERRCE